MSDLVYGANILPSSFAKSTAELADEYGINIWQKQYEESAQPYEQAYSQSKNQYDFQSKELKQDYSDVINKAYETYVTNKRAAEFSTLGTGDQRMFSESYLKAYEQNKKDYYKSYLESQSKLDEQMAKVETNYSEALYNIMSNIAQEQGTIATNSAEVLNKMYDYVKDELRVLADDEYLFGPTSPLYGLLKDNNELVEPSEFFQRFATEKDGQLVLNDDFEQLIKFLNSLELVKETDESGFEHSKYKGFNDYLLGKDKDLYSWYFENKDLLYKDLLGIENAYTYNPTEYKYADTLKSTELGTDYKFKTGDEVTNSTLLDVLNSLKSGDGDQQVVYRGTVYSYSDGKWRNVKEETAYERIKFEKTGKTEINGQQISLVSNDKLTLGRKAENEKQDTSLPYGTSNQVIYNGKTYIAQSQIPNKTLNILKALGDTNKIVNVDGRLYAYVSYLAGQTTKHKKIRWRNGVRYDADTGEILTGTAGTQTDKIDYYLNKWVELT